MRLLRRTTQHYISHSSHSYTAHKYRHYMVFHQGCYTSSPRSKHSRAIKSPISLISRFALIRGATVESRMIVKMIDSLVHQMYYCGPPARHYEWTSRCGCYLMHIQQRLDVQQETQSQQVIRVFQTSCIPSQVNAVLHVFKIRIRLTSPADHHFTAIIM